MKKHLLILFLLAFTTINCLAQQAVQIKQAAEAMAKATITSDYKSIIQYSHPKLIALMGGREKMMSGVKLSLEQIKKQGVKIEYIKIGDPSKVLNTPSGLYSTLSQEAVVSLNAQKASTTSTLLANSTDKGKTWTFVDASGMTDTQLKQLFPDVIGKFSIIKRSTPVPVK